MIAALARTAAIAAKEVLHVRRDPRTLYLALVMPVVLLLLFGYGVSFDIDHAPVRLIDRDRSEASRELAQAFAQSGEFDLSPAAGEDGLEREFRRGRSMGALIVPRDYGRDLCRGERVRVQLVVDAADSATANQLLAKAEAIALSASPRPPGAVTPIEVQVRTRYNPEERSAVFIVPGLAAYLLAISAVLLTALAVAGEWERGSMEQLFASSVGRLEIVLGKLLPYLGLGMLQLLLVLAVGASVFEVPIRGSLALIFTAGALFLAGMLGQGLLISVLARNQLVATQAGSLSSMLPSLLLSGMVVPLDNMPRVLQWLSAVVPARYFVHALRAVMLKGSGLRLVAVDLAAMAAFAVLIIAAATLRFRRTVA
ncbi:MAG TPA: ABC transporter permease [Myxococcales bacterium]|nr:ABC transporter permease [Myxococcales bacterium]